jgi:pimeloyl-ACP methyl ester carboxylesterase
LLTEFIPVGVFGKYKKSRIHTPTRLLFGTEDFALATSWMRGAEKYFDDYEVEYLPGTGHFSVDEQPDIVNDRAMKFFSDPKYNSGMNGNEV